MTLTDVLARRLQSTPRVSTQVGTFVGWVSGLARVNLQGSTVDVRCDGWYRPIPGTPVRVDIVDGVMRVVGPSQALSPRGTVVESIGAGTRARVTVEGSQYVLPVMSGYSPAPGEEVVINWQSGHVLGEEASAPEPDDPGTVGGDKEDFDNLLIQPTASGKYDDDWNNWWAPPEVWASNNNDGIWVYSNRFQSLKGADFTRVEFCFPRPIAAVGACYIGLHAYSSIPGGAPTITNLVAVPADRRSGWFRCPTWWGNHLRDNPSHGIGVTSGAGNNRWPGVGQSGGSQSGWMRFAGKR